jgi:hypothetical protein
LSRELMPKTFFMGFPESRLEEFNAKVSRVNTRNRTSKYKNFFDIAKLSWQKIQ